MVKNPTSATIANSVALAVIAPKLAKRAMEEIRAAKEVMVNSKRRDSRGSRRLGSTGSSFGGDIERSSN